MAEEIRAVLGLGHLYLVYQQDEAGWFPLVTVRDRELEQMISLAKEKGNRRLVVCTGSYRGMEVYPNFKSKEGWDERIGC